jgi:hypothetical protein
MHAATIHPQQASHLRNGPASIRFQQGQGAPKDADLARSSQLGLKGFALR